MRPASFLALALGLAAGIALFAVAGPICETLLKLSPGLRAEAERALRVLAWVLPFVTVTGTLRGLLEAGQRFDYVNAIRVPLGVLTFAAPLAATFWSVDLVGMAIALGLVRVAAFAAHWAVSARLYPALVGFGVPLAPQVAFFPRVGMLFTWTFSDGSSSNSITMEGFAPVLFIPAPHFYIGFGPQFSTRVVPSGDAMPTFGLGTEIGGYF